MLDLNVKDTYMCCKWDAAQYEAGMAQLNETVNILLNPKIVS